MKTKWLISTVYSENYDDVAESSVPNHIGYARRHGYEYNVHHAPWGSENVYYNGYLLFILRMLPYYDAIAMIDVDVLFMNWHVSLDDIMLPMAGQQIAEEKLCETSSPINAGVVLFKNVESSYALLIELLKGKQLYGKNPLVWQAHLVDLFNMKSPKVSEFEIVPANTMNSHWNPGYSPSYKEGDFIIHFYMMSDHEKKARLCKDYSHKVYK